MKKLFVIGAMVLLTGCNHYYKATQLQSPGNIHKAEAIDSLKNEKRYFILRNGDRAFFMRNASISKDKQVIVSLLQNPGVDHRLHLINGRNGKLRYKTKIPHDRHVLNEVHFYITPDAKTIAGPNSLDLNSIQKIEIIEKDKKRTRESAGVGLIVGIVGVSAGLTLFIIAIGEAIASLF